MAGLKQRLMEPPLFEEFVREFTAELNRQRSIAAKEKGSLQEELARVAKQIDRLVEAIMQGADALALNAKLKTLEEQKAILENELKLAPDPEPLLHPVLAAVYRNKVERLEASPPQKRKPCKSRWSRGARSHLYRTRLSYERERQK